MLNLHRDFLIFILMIFKVCCFLKLHLVYLGKDGSPRVTEKSRFLQAVQKRMVSKMWSDVKVNIS